MTKISATFQTWRIEIADNDSVSVYENGNLCSNSKETLLAIARQVGLPVVASWTTRQIGCKLARFLNNGGASAQVAHKEVAGINEESKVPSIPAQRFADSIRESIPAKVRVYGKAQNRTALGIVHAYMRLFPHSTLEDLRAAFPNALNPDASVKENFIYAEEKGTTYDWNGYFRAEDEVLLMGDGRKVAMVSMWTRASFERMVAKASQYGIVVARFEIADKGGHKGGFRLEYIKENSLRLSPKKKTGRVLWLICGVLIMTVIILFCLL